jgi:V8-like Glu-specific endopeptidase
MNLMNRTYSLRNRLVAYCLLMSLFLSSCHHTATHPVAHDLGQAAYIPGRFEHIEDQEDANNNSMVLSAPPYRPVSMPKQYAQIYQGELQTLSYDKGKPEALLMKSNKDGRTRVNNTTQWPYLFHSQLAMTFPDEDSPYGGSGILVGPQHILTAAHNIYNQDKKAWAQKVVARLALNDNLAPYGEAMAKRIYTFKGWIDQGDTAHDMALLVLNKPIGYNTGWCGLLAATTKDLQNDPVNITGYPGDKGFNQMWSMSGPLKAIQAEELIYEIDTYGGQSGSGIWLNKWGSPYVVGVHTRGGNLVANIGNFGVRLSYQKAKQVISWMNDTLALKDQIKEQPVSLLPLQVTVDALVKEARNGNKEALMRLLDASHVSDPYVQLVVGKLYQEGVGEPSRNGI